MSETPQAIKVVAGVLQNEEGRYLVAQRPAGKHLAGLWEFPGGKVEAGETSIQALDRELQEEINVKVLAAQPLIQVRHQYAERLIELQIIEVIRWQGMPVPMEQQALQWVDYPQLCELPMPAADKPVCKALGLPSHYFISPVWDFSTNQWQMDIDCALEQSAGLLQVRQPIDNREACLIKLPEIIQYAHSQGLGVILNTAADMELPENCDGIHLNSQALFSSAAISVRERLGKKIIGASCHNLTELQQAFQLGCDYAVLSSVKPTRSHSDVKPMGWSAFSEQVRQINMPVYALGGLIPADLDQAREHGAVGVAGISSFVRRPFQ